MDTNTLRVLRALVTERRQIEREMQMPTKNRAIYWGARRKSIVDAINIVRNRPLT